MTTWAAWLEERCSPQLHTCSRVMITANSLSQAQIHHTSIMSEAREKNSVCHNNMTKIDTKTYYYNDDILKQTVQWTCSDVAGPVTVLSNLFQTANLFRIVSVYFFFLKTIQNPPTRTCSYIPQSTSTGLEWHCTSKQLAIGQFRDIEIFHTHSPAYTRQRWECNGHGRLPSMDCRCLAKSPFKEAQPWSPQKS